MAAHLHYLNSDDAAYNSMLVHKTRGTIENRILTDAMKSRTWIAGGEDDDFEKENFVESFECFLCSQIYRKQSEEDAGYSSRPNSVDTTHYSCPPPIHPVTRKVNPHNWWLEHWNHARAEANVIGRFAQRNLNYTSDEFHQSVFQEIPNVRWLLLFFRNTLLKISIFGAVLISPFFFRILFYLPFIYLPVN